MKLEAYTPYVQGVLGQEFKLTFVQKVKILFSKKITVILLAEKFNKRSDQMPDKKLTDSEIVKALECCNTEYEDYQCPHCPLLHKGCKKALIQEVLDPINRLQADCENYKQIAERQQSVTLDRGFEIKRLKERIESLQAENERLKNAYKQCAWERDNFQAELDEYEKIKTTIDEFWEILLTLSLCKRKEKPTLEEFAEAIQEIEAAAVTEFAERLKAEYTDFDEENEVILPENLNKAINDLLKEMAGEDNAQV